MTGKDDNTERERIMRQWADRVLTAHAELPEDFEATELEQLAIDTVRWLGHCFWSGQPPEGKALEILQRLESAFVPAEGDEQTVATARIVERYAIRVKELGGASYADPYEMIDLSEYGGIGSMRGMKLSDDPSQDLYFLVAGLVADLEAQVHPGFRQLDEKRTEVAALLSRYEPSQKGRGRPRRGEAPKLDVPGIVSGLNDLCAQRPLGSYSFSPRAVTAALNRKKT